MKRFFKAIAAPATVLCVVLALGLSMTRCTDVDDTLGQNFIPGHQDLKLQIKTLNSVRTYLAQNDSIASNYSGYIYFGQMTDLVFGETVASAMTDFFPATNTFNDQNYFGFNPVADSADIRLYVNNVYGNADAPQTFYVYALSDSLKRDSIYYFTDPIQNVVDLSTHLFTFVMDIREANAEYQVKLIPTPAGMDFLQAIADLDPEIYARPIPGFHEKFYGLYIAPEPGAPADGALYEIYSRSLTSSLIVYSHNYETESPATVKDNLTTYFRFSDASPYPNMNVNSVLHTYPQAMAEKIGNPPELATMTPQSTVYVQSLGGVATYLDFTEMAQELKALKPAGREIVVNQARIYFPIDNPTTAGLDAAPLRLGMYLTYGQQYVTPSSVYGPIPILDYMYERETTTNPLPYNGYIYRSTGWYEMNITAYVTQLIHDENVPLQVWLGNEVNTRSTKYTQLELQGSERTENPIKLVVTYTLVQ